MRFSALLLLTSISILQTQTASIEMKAAVGQTITVECPGATRYKDREIWWCKETSDNYCNHISRIYGDHIRNADARTSIVNTNGKISVTIKQLQETDTGTYWCGPEEQNSIHVLDVVTLQVFSVLRTQTATIEMKAAVGETITVECSQTTQHKPREIWGCKETSETYCNHIFRIYGDRVKNVDARTSIVNTYGKISITIKQLQETDKGTYWCGDRYENSLRVLDAVILQVFPVLQTQAASIVMKAAVGETITVECPQTTQYQYLEIWGCKQTSETYCNRILRTYGVRVKNVDARTSIANTNDKISIIIQRLQETDTGTYWCGVRHENSLRVLDVITLKVFSVLRTQTASIVMKAAVGETVTVECPQATRHKQREIWWCKETSDNNCNLISCTHGDRIRNDDGRTSIVNTDGKISVNILQLKETDTGTYWCEPPYQNTSQISDVILLKVFSDKWDPIRSNISGDVGNAATIPCLFTDREKLYKKFLCKATAVNKCITIASSDGVTENQNNEKVSITVNNAHNFTVTMTNIDKDEEGEYWCGAQNISDVKIVAIKNLTITKGNSYNQNSKDQSNITSLKWYIILSVVLGLLILLLLVLFIFRRKMQRSAREQDKNENENVKPQTLVTEFDREEEDAVTYSAVEIQASTQRGENSIIYANLKNTKTQSGGIVINSSESVEYSTVIFGS